MSVRHTLQNSWSYYLQCISWLRKNAQSPKELPPCSHAMMPSQRMMTWKYLAPGASLKPRPFTPRKRGVLNGQIYCWYVIEVMCFVSSFLAFLFFDNETNAKDKGGRTVVNANFVATVSWMILYNEATIGFFNNVSAFGTGNSRLCCGASSWISAFFRCEIDEAKLMLNCFKSRRIHGSICWSKFGIFEIQWILMDQNYDKPDFVQISFAFWGVWKDDFPL